MTTTSFVNHKMNLAILAFVAIYIVTCLSNSPLAQAQCPESSWPFSYPRKHQRIFHFILSGRPEQAVDMAETLLSKYPEDAESYYMLAMGEAQLGHLDCAAEAMKRAIELGMAPSRFIAGPRRFIAPLSSHASYQSILAEHGRQPVHGPMLGALTDSSVKVWLRTASSSEIVVRVWPTNNESADSITASGNTTPASDFTAALALDGLHPDTEYTYETVIDGTTIRNPAWQFCTYPADKSPKPFSVVFGGGSQYFPENEKIWDVIREHKPRALLLLGDNVYIDDPWRLDMQRYCYYRRHSRPEWKRLAATVPIYSIWDDHDFGSNDSWGGPENMRVEWYSHDRQAGSFGRGQYFPDMASFKPGVFSVFQQNWVNPAYGDAPPWGGCWFKFAVGDVEFFMLDCRCYRTDPRQEHPTMLGPRQKAWLKDSLRCSDKMFKVIAASVPWDFDAKGDSLDTWNGYREEREELFSFIEDHRLEGVILLSADRHRSDAYRIPRSKGYDFYDLMSSHLTKPAGHTHATMDHALFSYNRRPAFGLLTFDTTARDPTGRHQIVNIDNEIVYTLDISLRTLRQAAIPIRK